MPNVPTIAEVGLPGVTDKVDLGTWTNLFAPKGTPLPILEKLNEALVKGLATSQAQERMGKLSLGSLPPYSVAEARKQWEQEAKDWVPVLTKLNLANSTKK